MSSKIDMLNARACERSVSGVENGAERAENRLKRSVAVSGQNLPLKIRFAIKLLKVKSSKSILKVTTNCQCKFITTLFVVTGINLII